MELAKKQQASCSPEDELLLTQFEQFKSRQSDEIQHLLSEWEEVMGYQQSKHKQAIYIEGVKDGIRLILPVMQPANVR
ncbi:hypothetical protein [Paenibacillus durus]|uniref:hypothetical protein n=1 Tax=Paenibacillus durus TaxID=44251 RepID=UPI0005A91A6A|nr:hypothetical protein [Paenibacillus durus]